MFYLRRAAPCSAAIIIALVVGTMVMKAAPAHAGGPGSITTIFESNGGGSNGGAVFFDITVNVPQITITGYDTNTAEQVAFDWSVYVILNDTHIGNENTMSAWTLVATGTGQGMGLDTPSPVALDQSILLPQGTHAMALVMGPQAGHDYTNGDGSNQNYSNGDVALALGSAMNSAFNGVVFTPRVWNGTIHYIVPAPAPLMIVCAGFMCAKRRRR